MKFYVVTFLFVICTIQCISADWRDDLTEKYSIRFSNFVRGLKNLLQTTATIKNTPAAWDCFDTATEKFTDSMKKHSVEIGQCVAPPAELPEATACCDIVRKKAVLESTSINNNALACINKS